MYLSLFLILTIGVAIALIFPKIKVPSLIGYLILGIVLSMTGLMDDSLMNISKELRKIALIIILLKAGLSLDINVLKKVGRPVILMSFVPATLEIISFMIFGPIFLNLSLIESILIGSVLGAVSPAVVIPRMSHLIDIGAGKEKGIPHMIIAGSSVDDVYCIVIFTTVSSILANSGDVGVGLEMIKIPSSIIFGIGAGLILGIIVSVLFSKVHIRDTIKLILLVGLSFLLVFIEELLGGTYVALSSLLGVITMGLVIFYRNKEVSTRLVKKSEKLWVLAEMFLFVLVGASVKLESLSSIGLGIILALLIGLVFRSIGTLLCLIKTNLNWKEKLFVVISELPKATVQAAIGGTLIGMTNINQDYANLVLCVSVLAILICAPIGAFGIDLSYKKLLSYKKDD